MWWVELMMAANPSTSHSFTSPVGCRERIRKVKVGKTHGLRWRQFSKWRKRRGGEELYGSDNQSPPPATRMMPSQSARNCEFGKSASSLIAEHDALKYGISLWFFWVSSLNLLSIPRLPAEGQLEIQTRPLCCGSTALQQLIVHWCVMTTALVTYELLWKD